MKRDLCSNLLNHPGTRKKYMMKLKFVEHVYRHAFLSKFFVKCAPPTADEIGFVINYGQLCKTR